MQEKIYQRKGTGTGEDVGEERVSKDTVEEEAGKDIAGRGEENTIHAVETLVTKTIVPSQAGHSYRRVLYHARPKII